MKFKPAPVYKFQVGKVEVEAVSIEEAEQAEFIVCLLVEGPLLFPDNQTGKCMGCSRKVQFRPDAPVKPPRLCLECATVLYGKQEQTH